MTETARLPDFERHARGKRADCSIGDGSVPTEQGSRGISLDTLEAAGKVEYGKACEAQLAPWGERRSLNVPLARLAFLPCAGDAGPPAERQRFHKRMKDAPADRTRTAPPDPFSALGTPEGEQGPCEDPTSAAFPYVNGDPFRDVCAIPQPDEGFKEVLLGEAGAGFGWRGASPSICGSAFEAALNPATRHETSAHLTSTESIRKLIGPLFLDDLKAEPVKIEGMRAEKRRNVKLGAFRRKIAGLRLPEPAFGSGAFRTVACMEPRKLELRAVGGIQGSRTSALENPIMVSMGQFHGMEVGGFAVSVAGTAPWIAGQQVVDGTQEPLPLRQFGFPPLGSIAHLHCGGALAVDRNGVLPAQECDCILGSPPFPGAPPCSPEQEGQVVALFTENGKDKVKLSNPSDCVSGWCCEACGMASENPAIRCASVSTDPIRRGGRVAPTRGTLRKRFDVGIDFARGTFIRDPGSAEKAHVHCVIVGFSRSEGGEKREIPFGSDGTVHGAGEIGPYLADGPFAVVESRGTPISHGRPIVKNGSKPTDGGWYLFADEGRDAFVNPEPGGSRLFRPRAGSKGFVNGARRWCLCLGDVSMEEMRDTPLVLERVESREEGAPRHGA